MNEPHFLSPPWSGRYGIEVYSTTRLGGYSKTPFNSFNLGLHVDDDAPTVQRNRDLLSRHLKLKRQPVWLRQVHGTKVICGDEVVKPLRLRSASGSAVAQDEVPEADASWTAQRLLPLAVLTADCLPIVLVTGAHQRFSVQRKSIAVVHAGWRGLAAGILQNAIETLDAKPGSIAAWLGPAIGPQNFEVGLEVRQEFLRNVPGIGDDCFFDTPPVEQADTAQIDEEPTAVEAEPVAGIDGKCYADLYAIARTILAEHNIDEISGGNNCTYRDQDLFFSYRRDGALSGRMATVAVIRDN